MSDMYLANRLKYHAASRVGAKETDPLLNALNIDGHTVLTSKVWSSGANEFPVNTAEFKTTTNSTNATNYLATVFKTGATSTAYANGLIWTNPLYPAVKLYENVEMTPVAGSNGAGVHYESYEIIGNDAKRVMDWVSPMAAFDSSNGKPTPGFAGKVEVYKGSKWTELQDCADVSGNWALSAGNWEFIYGAGIITFNAAYTPTKYSYTKVRWTGFQYVGKYLTDTLNTINTNIENSAELFDVNVPLVAPYAGTNEAVESVTIVDKVVTIVINGKVTEILAADGEELVPDQVYAGGKTTLTADFGTSELDSAWVITYRVVA